MLYLQLRENCYAETFLVSSWHGCICCHDQLPVPGRRHRRWSRGGISIQDGVPELTLGTCPDRFSTQIHLLVLWSIV